MRAPVRLAVLGACHPFAQSVARLLGLLVLSLPWAFATGQLFVGVRTFWRRGQVGRRA